MSFKPSFSLGSLLIVAAFTSAQLGQIGPIGNWPGQGYSISPPYNYIFDFPLPIPPIATPYISTNIRGIPIQYYPIEITKFTKKIYPNLSGTASLVGYNGSSPGPMIKVPRNTRSVLRMTNNGDVTASTHLHGSETRAPWDGWAADIINPGQFKDYFYPNAASARSLWYHDHAVDHTGSDAYFGLNGAYLITDPLENKLGLPAGKYDVPLMLMDKIYDKNGNLVSPENERVNFFGDIIHVNGQPWPYLQVEPRKYRLRLLNAALSRPFSLYISQDNNNNAVQNFQVIASDGGLFNAPVTSSQLVVAMGERYEIVFDFSKFAGQNLTLGNAGSIPTIIDYQNTNKVMRFVVGKKVTDTSNNQVPKALSNIDFPAPRPTVDRVFDFEHNQENWTINGAVYDDVAARVLARPLEGTQETWELNYRSGPGVHPIHVHLVNFRIISRTGGRGAVQPYESAGMKDIALLAPGETVHITAIYGPWNGLYQFHCHNLIHEDHEMMDVFNVTANPILQKLGYTNLLSYDNPMDPEYRAKDIAPKYYTYDYIKNTLLPSLIGTGAYGSMLKVEKILSSYNAQAKPHVQVQATAVPLVATATPIPVLSTMLSEVTYPGTSFLATFVDVVTYEYPGGSPTTSTVYPTSLSYATSLAYVTSTSGAALAVTTTDSAATSTTSPATTAIARRARTFDA